ncbi:hypothetical protein D3C87_1656340 [compost metagenome]
MIGEGAIVSYCNVPTPVPAVTLTTTVLVVAKHVTALGTILAIVGGFNFANDTEPLNTHKFLSRTE